jgi:transcriptional regulator with XRE-family HTH domain
MAEASTPALAAIIDKLFTTIRRPNGDEHSRQEVAEWCTKWLLERGEGGTFSKEYMRQLRNGTKANPTKRHLEALAAFFDVDPAIFLDSGKSKQIQRDLELAVAIRDADVLALALHAASLTPNEQKKVMAFMQSLKADRKPNEKDNVA